MQFPRVVGIRRHVWWEIVPQKQVFTGFCFLHIPFAPCVLQWLNLGELVQTALLTVLAFTWTIRYAFKASVCTWKCNDRITPVLTRIENTGQYCKASSHFLLVKLLPYILFSYSTLLGKKTPTPPKTNKPKPQTNTTKPSRNPKQKPDTKPLSSHIVHVLRVHMSVEKSV